MADEKILKEEILNDDELDHVAGGTYHESADDAKKFKELGVTIKDNGGIINKNQYFIGDTEVTRETAWAHVESQLKK